MDLQNLRLAADVGQVAWRCSTRVTRVMLQRQRVTSAGLVVILCARLTRFSYFLVLIYLLIVSSCASYRAMSCCRVGGWLESFLTRVRACLNSAKRNSSNRKEKVKGACVCGVRAWCTKAWIVQSSRISYSATGAIPVVPLRSKSGRFTCRELPPRAPLRQAPGRGT